MTAVPFFAVALGWCGGPARNRKTAEPFLAVAMGGGPSKDPYDGCAILCGRPLGMGAWPYSLM